MTPLTPPQINEWLQAAPPQATVYLIGAGGCGMSGLGHLLLDLGFRVVGSDLMVNEEIHQLRARGADIHRGHAAAQVHAAQPILVVYTTAVRRDNPELQAAEERRIPLVRRALLLAALLHRSRGICVAGMHGKTTTSAWLAFALEQLGAHPSYAIGARLPQLQPHARLSSSAADPVSGHPPYFVVEADESDGTLREFQPEHSIVLNIDAEHFDYYANIEAVEREFQQFAAQTRGRLVFCADDPRLGELFARRPGAISYGFHPLASYRIELQPPAVSLPVGTSSPAAAEPRPGAPSRPVNRFSVGHAGQSLGEFTTALWGDKNISNATAVIALLHQLGFAVPEIALALAPFQGANRRQEELFADGRFRVIDDYGHHPAEIRATLQALNSLQPRRVLVAFQPHRYTRTRHLLDEFALCFREADQLWLTEVYSAGEAEIPGVNSARLAEAMRAAGRKVELISTLPELTRAVRAALRPGDLALFIGAGDITSAAHRLAALLRDERPPLPEHLVAELTSRLSPATVLRRDEPLGKRTTLRVGGTADIYVEPASENELAEILKFCATHALKFTLLGRGSNLLIKDGGIRGLVICLAHSNFSRVEIMADRLHCGAGAKLKTVAVEARRRGLTGLEFLEGIPGSVGGAMRMNAGAMGAWLFDTIERIRFMDFAGAVRELEAGAILVEYRGCPLFKNHIALGAILKGEFAPAEAIHERMTLFNKKRWESQPSEPSAGCIFKNPSSIAAGKLIDELGLKGTRTGGARVSEIHGNFIVNDGCATAQDVLNLIELVQERARAARGIELETEVEIVGEDG